VDPDRPRVTLVYRGRYWVRQALELETLAAVIRAAGCPLRFVYDSDSFGVSDNVFRAPRLARLLSSPPRMVQRICASRPDVLLFSVLPGSYAWSRSIARQCKALLGVPVVFLGLHPSLAPERVMRDEVVDCVIEGEAENVVVPLVQALAAGRQPHNLGSLWYRDGADVLRTARAPLVDLDALPFPDKDLFAGYVSQSFSYAAVVSRGCPHRCTFCEETCAKQVHGPAYFRRKSVEASLAELAFGKRKYGFREVLFKDSYLSGNKRWLREFTTRYRREIGVPFKCFCTIESFDAETARLLADSGCYSIEFGLQTWNPEIRRRVLGRNETNQQALEAFRRCAELRLWYDVDHMFDLPGETERDHAEGALAYRGLSYLNRVKVHNLVYLPGAEIVETAQAAGAVPSDIRQRLADGSESDFYDQAASRATAGFAALYKLLPLLPPRWVRWIVKEERVRHLARLPAPVVALLQGALAVRSRDLRFLAYSKLYPARLARAGWDRIRPFEPGARRT
jgi:anaerobic magnesium-protoporphyrin IX monomethyl ester cyclase